MGSLMLAGCTFLIDFEAAPSGRDGGDGGRDGAVPIGPPDVRVEPGDASDAAAITDAGADVLIANPDACKGKTNGKYCAGNQIEWPGSTDDLITCISQVVGVRRCTTGGKCLRMPNGFPDQCDQCVDTPLDGGTYCGRDFAWEPKNADRLVKCQNHAVVSISPTACVNGCLSKGALSACK